VAEEDRAVAGREQAAWEGQQHQASQISVFVRSAAKRKCTSGAYLAIRKYAPSVKHLWSDNNYTKEDGKMPRGDGTGPMGMGSMTGRALGYCAGFNTPGYANPAGARGFAAGAGRRGFNCGGRGFYGGGHGNRNMYYATGLPGWMRGQGSFPSQSNLSHEDEADRLKSLETSIVKELEEIRKRISELTKS
jgi:hypothetical protein